MATSPVVKRQLISARRTLGTAGSCWQGYKIEEKLDICSVKAFMWHTKVEDGDDNLLCCPGDHLSSTKKFLRSFLERRKYPRCLAEFNGSGKYPAAGKNSFMKTFSGVQRKLSSLSTGWLERRRSKQPKTSQRLNSKGKALLGELLHRFFSLSQRSR